MKQLARGLKIPRHEGSPTTESTERDPILDAGALEPANASSEVVESCGSAMQAASGEVQAPPSAPLLDMGRAQGKMLAGRSIALQREVLSDVDDVSTDSEFIKVNVIDARDVAYRVPGGKGAKPEPQRGKLRPVGIKIKVNRHVIESSRSPTSASSFSSAIMQAAKLPARRGRTNHVCRFWMQQHSHRSSWCRRLQGMHQPPAGARSSSQAETHWR